jgi:hypothetical protein
MTRQSFIILVQQYSRKLHLYQRMLSVAMLNAILLSVVAPS